MPASSIDICDYCSYRVDENHNIRIADFGLTKDIYTSEYYRGDKHDALPVKWMAPESIDDFYFDEKTDVVSVFYLLYSTVVLHIRDHGGLGFTGQIIQLHNTILVPWQYCLDIAKPKSAFSTTLNASIRLLRIFKKKVQLTNCLMPYIFKRESSILSVVNGFI